MTFGSIQLREYLRLRPEMSMEDAATRSGLSLGEARLTDTENARSPIELPPLPETPAAGIAVTEGDTPMSEPDLLEREPDTEAEAEIEADDEVAEREDPVILLASDTLRGDIRDALLDWIKATQKPWSQMTEAEQRSLASAADRFAGTLVKEACQLIAASERPCIVAQLVEYKEKDGVEAKLKLPSKGEVVAALHEACGREVLLVTSGYEEFNGQAADAEIDADQPAFPNIGEEYRDAA